MADLAADQEAAQLEWEQMRAELARLRTLLGTYGYHIEYCPAFDAPPGVLGFACECGWGELAPEFEAPGLRCENAGCGSGAWLTDDDECPECGWRAVTR
jgi:hypothetical protein